VNLTLYDFTAMTLSSSTGARDVIPGISGSSSSSSSSFCRRLAVVRDVVTGREKNVCGGGARRVRHAYLSDGNRVEVVMATGANNAAVNAASDAGAAHFLVRYEGWRIGSTVS